jgi:geranylgeranyl diphosphate synthase type II
MDATKLQYETRFASTLEQIQNALRMYLSGDNEELLTAPKGLWEAMRYSTLDGGKRIRSVLAIETCLACGGSLESILPTACAIELVHAQSLIHDDLPCMDNDNLRRGRPTLHIAYGESTAVLAGDALLAMAFGLITKHTPRANNVTANSIIDVISDFSDVTSVKGLVNGQYVDIQYEEKPFDAEVLEYIHTYKTGALFRFSTRAGAMLANADTATIEKLTQWGQTLGLAFQIVDDLLDIQSTSETLGKTVGKDMAQQKATFPALYGMEESRKKALELVSSAQKTLAGLTHLKVDSLHDLAEYIHTRIS